MLNTRVKEITAHLNTSGKNLPGDELLSELFLQAMFFVASKCVPSELVRRKRSSSDIRVLRNIEDECFICVPDKPNFSNKQEHLMIDEELTYAVINEVLFLINQEPFYRELAMQIIAQYNANNGREFYER
ncbi:hypothetical protein CPIN17260_1078 [Campylobacter pinnipediorum subsp. pinnipediorum]|uniref:Uncharacterized protein n=1 Tax=Campylobacter pinnipediorum subsp. pinnipediorum TaxID=1660067 RepID=A0AAX0L9K6_9BACT|nr:hypothetical protein [Campylobacter pinnipediorum]AQW81367.1 hypothetical protein CPIN17260_1078 [Campylobacter pinnipediorum subsp. pinnipediorum]OPA77335.1 hypothetical protein BFG04_04365 [Campylobacter pinnipediorum subsp. pinnipediorum]